MLKFTQRFIQYILSMIKYVFNYVCKCKLVTHLNMLNYDSSKVQNSIHYVIEQNKIGG
jgi:hypothetical protein